MQSRLYLVCGRKMFIIQTSANSENDLVLCTQMWVQGVTFGEGQKYIFHKTPCCYIKTWKMSVVFVHTWAKINKCIIVKMSLELLPDIRHISDIFQQDRAPAHCWRSRHCTVKTELSWCSRSYYRQKIRDVDHLKCISLNCGHNKHGDWPTARKTLHGSLPQSRNVDFHLDWQMLKNQWWISVYRSF